MTKPCGRLRERAATLFLGLASLACASQPSSVSSAPEHLVLVKTARIPDTEPWVSRFAQHSWVDIKRPGGWRRVEILSASSGVLSGGLDRNLGHADVRWGRAVHVVASFSGAEARRIGRRVLELAPSYPEAEHYRAWPGPNSNTFIEWLAHEVDGFEFELYPNAVGKDYGGWLGMGTTSSGTGVELETAWVGAQVGLTEGVELHLLGLTLGVGFWPPRLKLPFLASLPFGYSLP